MTIIIFVLITLLFCTVAALGGALHLIRRELYRRISSAETFLIQKIVDVEYGLRKEIFEHKKPTFDDAMTDIMRTYGKILEEAVGKLKHASPSEPPAKEDPAAQQE